MQPWSKKITQSMLVRPEIIRPEMATHVNPQDPPPLGSPVRDVPPFEIKDTPPREPAPWITPEPDQKDDFNDGLADA